MVAASLAMDDAALVRGAVDPDRLGVSFGAGRISTTPEELDRRRGRLQATRQGASTSPDWDEQAMGEICPLWLLRQLPNMPACHVSIEFDARGPNNTITCRESSALLALAEAVGVIRRGAADCMIVGASSSNMHPVDIAKLSLFDGLSRRVEDPQGACRPFDFDRDGTIVGEGGAAFVVERYNHAVRRGARIYAEVLGVAAGCDGTGFSNGNGGTGLVRAIRSAMRQASLRPSDLGHINAHGKSTQRDDLVEACAFHRAFDNEAESIPVTALKSYFGHFDAGSGAVELAGSLLALEHGSLPMTLNYETPDPRFRLRVVHREPLRSAKEDGPDRQSHGNGPERCRDYPRRLALSRETIRPAPLAQTPVSADSASRLVPAAGLLACGSYGSRGPFCGNTGFGRSRFLCGRPSRSSVAPPQAENSGLPDSL